MNLQDHPKWLVFKKRISATETAVLLMNNDKTTATVTADVSSFAPCAPACKIRDVLKHADIGSSNGNEISAHLDAHASAFYILS